METFCWFCHPFTLYTLAFKERKSTNVWNRGPEWRLPELLPHHMFKRVMCESESKWWCNTQHTHVPITVPGSLSLVHSASTARIPYKIWTRTGGFYFVPQSVKFISPSPVLNQHCDLFCGVDFENVHCWLLPWYVFSHDFEQTCGQGQFQNSVKRKLHLWKDPRVNAI